MRLLGLATMLFILFSAFACGSGSGDPIITDGDGDTDTIDTVDGDTEPALDGDPDTTDHDTADPDTIDSDTADGDLPDGDPDTTEEADSADSDTAEPDQEIVCASNACAIGGICYTDGLADPTSPCRKCDVAVTKTAWTNSSYGQTCNDGNSCTKDDACDGQGACKGTDDPACQADGDSEYDTDINPEDVAEEKACPERGLRYCYHNAIFECGPNGWAFDLNCANASIEGACAQGLGNRCYGEGDPNYPTCTGGDTRCVGDIKQRCSNLTHTWGEPLDCTTVDAYCYLGSCFLNER